MEQTKSAKHTGHAKLTGAFDLFPKSLEVVKRNLGLFALLNLLPLLGLLLRLGSHPDDRWSSWGSFTGFSDLPTYTMAGFVVFGSVIALLLVITGIFIKTMTVSLQLEGARGAIPNLKQLFETAKKYWLRLLGLEIVIGLFIIGGLILLIVPGFIMLRRYFLAPYFMLDRDLGIKAAMRASAETSKPYAVAIWSVIGVTFLLGLAGVIPIIGAIIALVLEIAYSVAPALRYLELKKISA